MQTIIIYLLFSQNYEALPHKTIFTLHILFSQRTAKTETYCTYPRMKILEQR